MWVVVRNEDIIHHTSNIIHLIHIFHLTSSILHRLEETKAKIADLQYIKNELAGIPNLV